MSSPAKPSKDQVIELIAPRKFHQKFTLPATPSHEPLIVTYAIAGKEHGGDTPTILFCGGMFGSRWMAILYNWLAEEEGVRMIFIDRPGFGGSTPVSVSQRIPIYLEVVPALLEHLGIKHVSIAAQSAGTIFALNLLSRRPEILSPENPTFTLFSPWVHQSISGVSFLIAASKLPDRMLNNWSDLIGFVVKKAQPTFAASGVVTSMVTDILKSTAVKESEKLEEEKRCMEGYGIGPDVKEDLIGLIHQYAFEEQHQGGNDEARLCLKSVEGTNWDACEDLSSFIKNLNNDWETKVKENGAKRLQVRIVFAEEDAMIGGKGKKYFEDCWKAGNCGVGVDMECIEIEDSDHDSVIDASKGPMKEMFAALREKRSSFTVPLVSP